MMKIGLVGYGKAGQAAARVLVNDPGYELQWLWRRQGSETLPMEGHAGPLICGMENLDIGAWIVGHHDVIFGFPHQTVRLIHDSIRPEALGAGGAYARQELRHCTNGMYSFDDLLLGSIRQHLLTAAQKGASR